MRAAGWALTQPAVAKIELGKRPLRLAEAVDLAQALGVRVDDLVASPLLSAHMRFRDDLRMRDRELDAATYRRSDAESRIRRLSDLSRLPDGDPVYWGDPPSLLRDLLGDLQDAHVDGILLEIGLIPAEVDSISKSSDRWGAMWRALHERFPNFHDASAIKPEGN